MAKDPVINVKTPPVMRRRILGDWRALVGNLIDEARTWANEMNWSTHVDTKTILEDPLGTYSVPTLRIRTPQGELWVDPIGRSIIGADGRVDMMAWPSHERYMLSRRRGGWQIFSDAGVRVRRTWNRRTFLKLAQDLVASR